MPASETSQLRGGAWLIEPTDGSEMLTPERVTDEHRLIGNTTQQFVEQDGDAEVFVAQKGGQDSRPGVQLRHESRA